MKGGEMGIQPYGLLLWDHFSQQMGRERHRIDYQYGTKGRSWGDCVKLLSHPHHPGSC